MAVPCENAAPWEHGALRVSDNGRFLQHTNSEPFFWLADTAWLLHKLGRADVDRYFRDRQRKGFNVVQVQVVPGSLDYRNHAGEKPFVDNDIRQPNESPIGTMLTNSSIGRPHSGSTWAWTPSGVR